MKLLSVILVCGFVACAFAGLDSEDKDLYEASLDGLRGRSFSPNSNSGTCRAIFKPGPVCWNVHDNPWNHAWWGCPSRPCKFKAMKGYYCGKLENVRVKETIPSEICRFENFPCPEETSGRSFGFIPVITWCPPLRCVTKFCYKWVLGEVWIKSQWRERYVYVRYPCGCKCYKKYPNWSCGGCTLVPREPGQG